MMQRCLILPKTYPNVNFCVRLFMMMMQTLTRLRGGPMPTAQDGTNAEVRRIVETVLGDLSMEQAAIRLGYNLSRTPIGDLKRGKVGREETVRKFAEGLWERFSEHYGEAVQERFGACTRETVSDWFAEKAGFGLRYSGKPAEEPPAPNGYPDVSTLAGQIADRVAERLQITWEGTLLQLTSGAEVLAAGLRDLEERYQQPDLKLRFRGGLESLTADQARSVLADLEQQLKDYQTEKEQQANK